MAENMSSIAHVDTGSTKKTECNYDKHDEWDRSSWLTVIGSSLVFYSSIGVINSFGFFQDYYQKDYLAKASPTLISIIGTLQLTLMNCLSTVSGGMCDAHGVKHLYIFAGVGTSAALLVLSFCTRGSLWQVLLIQGFCMGVTIAFGAQPAYIAVAQQFTKKRALAMGIVSCGSAVGGVCYSLMFTQLQPLIGFEWAMRIAAAKVLICYSVALFLSSDKPTGKTINVRTLVDFRGFMDGRYAVLALGGCFLHFGLWTPGFHIKAYVCTAYPETCESIGRYMLPIMNSSGIPGMIVGGLLGDRFGRLNILCPMALLSGVLCLSVWLFAPSVSILTLFTSLYGFSSGAVISLLPSVVSQISPSDKVGARIGAFYAVISIGSLTGTPIGSALLGKIPDTKDDYRRLIVFSGTAMVIGSLVLFAARFLHDRNLRARW